jgi:hypothetical protein
MSFHLVNPSDKDGAKHRYIIALGAYGWTKLLVWANSLDKAIELSIDWTADNEPGHLANEAVHDEYQNAIAEGLSEEKAQERAEVDIIQGDHGNCMHSWEINLVVEDPDRATLKEIIANSSN